jgi:leader peptidase (prepilin peptidase)/N-methyltransferase
MDVVLTVVFALFGAAVGSFLNVCIDRLPAGKSPVSPASHCDACQQRLPARDLVPVFSYLWRRGRCRYCRAPIPRRVFWVEIGSGLLFAFIYWHYGLGVELAIAAFYCCLFIVLGVIDLEHRLILNKIVYPAAVVALIISLLHPPPVAAASPPWPEMVSGMIGGAIGFVFLMVPAVINPRGMGWGDVKMAGLIGLATGFPLVLVALVSGAVLGGLVAVALVLLKKKKRQETIPFGPFLSLAAIISLFWGNNIFNWYLGLF